jgi:uncharacterized protein YjaZ
MGIIRTDKWLLEHYESPLHVCEKLEDYFQATALEIYDYLYVHGMYHPVNNGINHLKPLLKANPWKVIQDEYHTLQELWEGPDIPIFIFPFNNSDSELALHTGGKSGLAFRDKLFLFLSEENSELEIRALFTHEYNHVCRLEKYRKKEEDYTLLDTIILEGLAECAVKERYGKKYQAKWISTYDEVELKELWNTIIYPNQNVRKNDYKHQELLFGSSKYPKMIGYCVGYYLVTRYIETNNISISELLVHSSREIAHKKTDGDSPSVHPL